MEGEYPRYCQTLILTILKIGTTLLEFIGFIEGDADHWNAACVEAN